MAGIVGTDIAGINFVTKAKLWNTDDNYFI